MECHERSCLVQIAKSYFVLNRKLHYKYLYRVMYTITTVWFIYISTRWQLCYINWTKIKQFYACHDFIFFIFLKILLTQGFIYNKPHNHGPPRNRLFTWNDIEWLRKAVNFQKYVLRHAAVKYTYNSAI